RVACTVARQPCSDRKIPRVALAAANSLSMAGLDPAIQSNKRWCLGPWMGGSSPPMEDNVFLPRVACTVARQPCSDRKIPRVALAAAKNLSMAGLDPAMEDNVFLPRVAYTVARQPSSGSKIPRVALAAAKNLSMAGL
ncbi:MAG TPA: hypothetical protein VHX18_08165, partial [Rhizomicrobium sp.]|nr:hypothetical protein [Rhizomicrobium sp.]